MANASSAAFWLRRARLLAVAVNAAWVWQRMLPILVVLNLLLAASVLIIRQSGGNTGIIAQPYLVAVLISLIVAAVRIRSRSYSVADALLRIETALGLHNRLSCAAAGVTEWPAPTAYSSPVLRLRPLGALLPLLYSGAFILAALWLPVRSAPATSQLGDIVEPAAWSQVAQWAELLQEEQVVADIAADGLEERLGQLRNRPVEEWYRQGSLEAGEALRDETVLAMQELARQLQAAAVLLEQIPLLEPDAAAQMEAHWQKQLQGMQGGLLPLESGIQEQLQALDFSQSGNLSSEQLQALQQQLQGGAQNLGAAAGLSDGDLDAAAQQALQAGSGEAAKGPGAAPMVMSPNAGNLPQISQFEGLNNQELHAPVLGQNVGITTRPDNEEDTQVPFQTGIQTDAPASEGEGGSAVWQENYTPRERSVLERYFQ